MSTKDFPSSHVEKRVRPWKPSRWFGGRRSQGGVRDVTGVEKNEMISLMLENLLGPSVTSGNVGPDRVSRRASHFLEKKSHATKQTKQNVTDVLLGLPADRDGPCPTRAVLHRISHSFHRGCRIAGRIERLEQWWVDLDVSEHEADWACFACL